MPSLTIDHVALPCFDVPATHHFYGEILGCPLIFAQSGSAEAWNASEYLLLAYGLPDGTAVDLFSFDGIVRPPDDGLPKDIRHLALATPGRADVVAYRERLTKASISFWTEVHGTDDLHVYVTDPNGTVIEILAAQDGSRHRPAAPEAARQTLARWLASRSAAR
jgi:catechol 2,3-dioxygenase-like lactoylglutathione lyase family enzyme